MARKRVSEKEIVVSAPVPARHKTATPRRPRRAAAETAEPAVAAAAEITIVAAEQVAHLAYSYWEARGYQGGSPEEDWLRAEKELRAQSAVA
jgi:Protein of unknown function (DUF2934)